MANDSTTSGPLLPDPNGPAPLVGQALNQFLQGWLVGISGFDPTLIRPRWQAEPPNIPTEGTCWMAFGVRTHSPDTYGYVRHDPAADGGLGADDYQRHESLDILMSFYDLGVSGQADYYASLIVDGLQIDQNLELLQINGFGLTETKEPTAVPVLFKERWQYRVDLELSLRRQIRRTYRVRNILKFQGTITVDTSPVLTVPVATS